MRVEVSASKLSFPTICACCGAAANAELAVSASRTRGKRVTHTTTRSWQFPYCDKCIAHVADWTAGANAYSMIALLLLGGGIGCIWFGVASFVIGLVLALIPLFYGIYKQAAARSACSSECAAAGSAVAYLGWYGSVQAFELRSPPFAAAFLTANERKLVNVSEEAMRALQGARATTAARALPPPTVAAPASTVSAPDQKLLKWVAKLESLKGPAARRTALQTALAEMTEPKERQQLLLEASKIEVQAALDKADGLKTVAAKRRTLEAALQALREDEVPDNLQAQQIEWLEAAIRELDGGG